MKRVVFVLIALVAVMMIVPAAFAQEKSAAPKPPINPTALAIAAGFGVAIAAVGGGLGQGRIAAAGCEGIARNPGAAGNVQTAMLIGLVFVETLTLFTFVMGIILFLKL